MILERHNPMGETYPAPPRDPNDRPAIAPVVTPRETPIHLVDTRAIAVSPKFGRKEGIHWSLNREQLAGIAGGISNARRTRVRIGRVGAAQIGGDLLERLQQRRRRHLGAAERWRRLCDLIHIHIDAIRSRGKLTSGQLEAAKVRLPREARHADRRLRAHLATAERCTALIRQLAQEDSQ